MPGAELWKFLAGLGFFLYGMSQLETVLKNTTGRSFKLFLKHNTKSLFKSITGGAIVTGIVQSSSVVSLIVLAFVEAGIISFKNAMGVILGTNLGTTLDSWIVATVGFKVDILSYSLPIVAVTAAGMFFFEAREKLNNFFKLFFSLGILFLGLGFMKEGAGLLLKDFDISQYNDYNMFVFVLIGFIITSIVQSSSATVAITLTAIYAGGLTLHSAAAVVIGSEIGTTLKIVLLSVKGGTNKKRVAWGNFIYNIFTTIIACIILNWLVGFIENTIKIKDPLIGLVFFQTAINVVSIVLFLPFLKVFSEWLGKRFNKGGAGHDSFIGNHLPLKADSALVVLQKEAEKLFKEALLFNKNILSLEKDKPKGFGERLKHFFQRTPDLEKKYKRIKQTEGDILEYYTDVEKNSSSEKQQLEIMLEYVEAARQAVYSAKSITDIVHNIREFDASANDRVYEQVAVIRKEWLVFDKELHQLFHLKNEVLTDAVAKTRKIAMEKERDQKTEIMNALKNEELNELEASTLMNVNREILACKKALLKAVNRLETE
ncbi:MAG: Na/Pi cotransporter family protein [Bacteroidia bacterium]|nr:Na/Pi cotransporter family protein [Bacteroidia bacterium]